MQRSGVTNDNRAYLLGDFLEAAGAGNERQAGRNRIPDGNVLGAVWAEVADTEFIADVLTALDGGWANFFDQKIGFWAADEGRDIVGGDSLTVVADFHFVRDADATVGVHWRLEDQFEGARLVRVVILWAADNAARIQVAIGAAFGRKECKARMGAREEIDDGNTRGRTVA